MIIKVDGEIYEGYKTTIEEIFETDQEVYVGYTSNCDGIAICCVMTIDGWKDILEEIPESYMARIEKAIDKEVKEYARECLAEQRWSNSRKNPENW